MISSIKNLLSVLRRFKMASFLNILGLGIAFASFSIIMMQVDYEMNYNRCHKDYKRIFRLEWLIDGENLGAVVPNPLARVLEQSPHVEQMSFYSPGFLDQSIVIHDGNEERHFQNAPLSVSKSFTKIFSFDFIHGDVDALNSPATVIIPESLAKLYFQNVSPLGQVIEFEDTARTVTGVYKDFPKNSTITNNLYCVTNFYNQFDNWYSSNQFAYFLLDSPENADVILEESAHLMNPDAFGCESIEELQSKIHSLVRLNPLDDLYYSNEVKYVFSEVGSRQTTLLLIAVALIVIIIAGINFTNFSTALTPLRIKGINTRKVLGSSVGQLRSSLVGEGIIISFMAFIVSLLIIYLCRGTFIEGFISSGIDISSNIPIIIATGLISIITGCLAGLYPAYYMTSFQPALVLKGSFGLSPKGRKIRTALLCVQYIASVTLLIVSSFMILQNRHMLGTSFGYDKDQVVTVSVSNQVHKSEKAFIDALTQNDGIDYVGFSYVYLSCMDDAPSWGRQVNGRHIQFFSFAVTPDICKALGITIKEGRDFLESDTQVEGGAFIFNETAQKQYGIKEGDDVDGKVVGIMNDIVYSSFRRPVEPMAFHVFGSEGNWIGMPLNICYIRINKGSNYDAAVRHVERTLKEYDPHTSFEVRNLNSEIEGAYRHERSVSSLISLFSIISIIISLVGIYGLVVFETEYKRREIGVRKVFGSTTSEILKMFSFSYIRLIAVCTVIAIPLSYYFVYRWLGQFESRTPIYWWVFALAFVSITLITLLTCTYQNYKAASTNPAFSIKAE